MDAAYILNFLSRYKKHVSQYKLGQPGCPGIVTMWDSMVSHAYPLSAQFKLSAPSVSRSKQEEDDAEYDRLAEEDRKVKEAEDKAIAEQLVCYHLVPVFSFFSNYTDIL